MDHHHQPTSGTATFLSCVANLSNTILGTGMLAMAHGFAQGGLIIGFVTVVICGLMAYLGLYLLSLCAAHPSIPHRTASFSSISKLTYPQASTLFDLAIAVKCFGVSISYLLIFGKLMPQVILSFKSTTSLSMVEDMNAENTLWLLDRRLWITLSMLVLVPVSFLPTLDSLRHISYVALIGVFNLIIVVIFKFCLSSDPLPSKSSGAEIHWIILDSSFLTALPLFVFAYTCAQNIFSVHNEMIDNSPRQMKNVLLTCIGSAVGTYEIVGVLGYLTFGSKVSSNLISDYESSIFISISRFTISLLVLFSYPLQLFPCRSSLIKVLNQQLNQGRSPQIPHDPLPTTSQELEREEGVDEFQEVEPSNGQFRDEPISVQFYVGITAFLLLGSFLIAVNVERLETVLGFVGSTGSTTISYILPGLFFRKLFPAGQSVSPSSQDPNSTPELSNSGRYSDHQQTEDQVEEHAERRSSNLDERQQAADLVIEPHQLILLRKLSFALVVAGFVIMIVCFSLNIHDAFF
ncbi:hypothetical protein PSTG_03184 [Puccinia striiformis f. sp. tritici PST-78]|uniref:Amino acid transporter transmembrane domain-containing protein n=1 Tax=Puccinia striiformis f. sp. tritici PST-78 TaxID=1165861 RepID=A0A0L0VWH2_9BASI|nr:hypothetical protein PSTG_03184 [Puccinia striiformis f. sp. tritici PST-78]